MKTSIKDVLKKYGIDGDIVLYRDNAHKKKALCGYLAQIMPTDEKICTYSIGAFGVHLAKAYPNNEVVIFARKITDDYKQQVAELDNVVINEGEHSPQTAKQYAEQHGYFFVNQFENKHIKEYYKQHFVDILKEVGKVDAFCDCGHSCATLAGAIESGASLKFVLGVFHEKKTLHHLAGLEDKFMRETTRNFDTVVLQEEIERAHPSFGNVFEATRSISAAMAWLQKNPNKTVLVYVGDSPVLGQDATI